MIASLYPFSSAASIKRSRQRAVYDGEEFIDGSDSRESFRAGPRREARRVTASVPCESYGPPLPRLPLADSLETTGRTREPNAIARGSAHPDLMHRVRSRAPAFRSYRFNYIAETIDDALTGRR